MAALDFPASPTTGQLFTSAGTGVTYMWNGTIWIVQAGPGGGTGDFCANQTSAFPTVSGTAFATMILTQVITGNSGGWYSTSTGRYTPPAGRYAISGGFSGFFSTSATATLGVKLRKNGVDLADSYAGTAASPSGWNNVNCSLIVDANGIDWFDMQGSCNNGALTPENMTFQAFPLTGMQGPSGGSMALVTISDTAPVLPLPGAMWWNSVLGTLFFYYQDVDSSQWVPASPAATLPAAQSIILYWSPVSGACPTTSTAFGWDVVSSNTTGGTYSSGTGNFTVPTGGDGLWDVQIAMTALSTASPWIVVLELFVNGVVVADSTAYVGTPGAGTCTLNRKVVLAAGNTVRTNVSSGGSTTIYGTALSGSRGSCMSLTRIGA